MKAPLASLALMPALLAAQPAMAGGPLLADMFSDHAVLQRGRPIPLWGRARPGERISVTLAGRRATTVASADGRWSLAFPLVRTGGPYRMDVHTASGERQVLEDILVGEVWLCSGQSNMEWPVKSSANAAAEIERADFPAVRLLQIARHDAPVPLETLPAGTRWQTARPSSVTDFSAACYFFGRDLHRALGVPIGLIHASFGGSVARAWLSPGALNDLGGYTEALDLMALRARSPVAAAGRWEARMDAWWQARDPGLAGNPAWFSPVLDDAAWPRIPAPGAWERAGSPPLRDFDGVVWLRRTLDLPAAMAARPVTLALGRIDNWDSVWVNGVLVGQDRTWSNERRYALPAGLLRTGRNLIAVRVLDAGADGGLLGGGPFALQSDGQPDVALTGDWAYRIAAPLAGLGPLPQVPWLGGASTGALFNGMIAPTMPYGLRGIAWYQGESDRREPADYARLLPALLADWRVGFGQNLPFLIVQLAGFGATGAAPGTAPFAEIREVQRQTVARDPAAALVVTADVGDAWSIHPLDKQTVGQRLALAARRLAYRDQTVPDGPRLSRIFRQSGAIVAQFNASGALRFLAGSTGQAIELCDRVGLCWPVTATIDGQRLVLPDDPRAVRLRHAWSDLPSAFLTDDAGLPASPFAQEIDERPMQARGRARPDQGRPILRE